MENSMNQDSEVSWYSLARDILRPFQPCLKIAFSKGCGGGRKFPELYLPIELLFRQRKGHCQSGGILGDQNMELFLSVKL